MAWLYYTAFKLYHWKILSTSVSSHCYWWYHLPNFWVMHLFIMQEILIIPMCLCWILVFFLHSFLFQVIFHFYFNVFFYSFYFKIKYYYYILYIIKYIILHILQGFSQVRLSEPHIHILKPQVLVQTPHSEPGLPTTSRLHSGPYCLPTTCRPLFCYMN